MVLSWLQGVDVGGVQLGAAGELLWLWTLWSYGPLVRHSTLNTNGRYHHIDPISNRNLPCPSSFLGESVCMSDITSCSFLRTRKLVFRNHRCR